MHAITSVYVLYLMMSDL